MEQNHSDKSQNNDQNGHQNNQQNNDAKNHNTFKFALAQGQFGVGDINGNVQKILKFAREAKEKGANIVVFPELTLLGYPPEDLLLRPSLSDRVKAGIDALTQADDLKDMVMIVGYPHIDQHGTFNSIAILHDGQQKGFYHKQTLPNYGVFDERRYFSKGRNQVLFDFAGITIGLLIGADVWQDALIQVLKEQGADVAVVVNASPFEAGKQDLRKTVLAKKAGDTNLPILYVNSVGGQDDLVFDGGSMAVQPEGTIAIESERFTEQLQVVEFDIKAGQFTPDNQTNVLPLNEVSERYQALMVGLRDYVSQSGFGGVIVGLSGGVDSALTLSIAVDALGADKVYAVTMPYKYTSQHSLEDAEAQARRLNVSFTVCPIHDAVDGMRHTLAPLFRDKADERQKTDPNVQARARGMVLMALSNKFGHLVITSGNKTELAMGEPTLYGDMAGGFDVLKDVYKSQVFELAEYRNQLEDTPVIPERVLSRSKTDAHLPKGVADITALDTLLQAYIDADKSLAEMTEQGFDSEVVKSIVAKVDAGEYKRRQSAIGTKVSRRAFGRERRYPLVNGWAMD